MDENDVKVGGLMVLALAIVVGGALVGGLQCEREKQESFRACVTAGRPAAECAVSTRTAHP